MHFCVFSTFDYYKLCCCEHLCTSVCVDMCFSYLGYLPGNGITEPYGKFLFNFSRNCQTIFQSMFPPPQQHKLFCLSYFRCPNG